jgi:hypothetical protein
MDVQVQVQALECGVMYIVYLFVAASLLPEQRFLCVPDCVPLAVHGTVGHLQWRQFRLVAVKVIAAPKWLCRLHMHTQQAAAAAPASAYCVADALSFGDVHTSVVWF